MSFSRSEGAAERAQQISVRRSTIDDCDLCHTSLGPGHFHAARDEQTEREREKEALVNRALEENANQAIEIHQTTQLETTAASGGDGGVETVPTGGQ